MISRRPRSAKAALVSRLRGSRAQASRGSGEGIGFRRESTTRTGASSSVCSSCESSGRRARAVEDDAKRLARVRFTVRWLHPHMRLDKPHRKRWGAERLGGGRRSRTVPMPTAIASDSARRAVDKLTALLAGDPGGVGGCGGAAGRRGTSPASGSPAASRSSRACGKADSAAARRSPPPQPQTRPRHRRRESIPGPRPVAFSLGSSDPITTREIPASKSASTQGGCLP